MTIIKAKTTRGDATVSLYKGYQNAICVNFKLDNGGSYSGWSVKTLLGHTYHSLCLGDDVTCTNILEVMASIRESI